MLTSLDQDQIVLRSYGLDPYFELVSGWGFPRLDDPTVN